MVAKTEYIKMSRTLNKTASELPGKELSFKVHYWGGMPEHYDNPWHRHSFFEVCYVLSGEGIYLEAGREYPLRPGTLFCSRPGRWHQIKSQTGMELHFVAFEPDSSRSTDEALNRYIQLMSSDNIIVPLANDTVTAQTWRMILTMCMQERSMTKEMTRSFAYALFVAFCGEFAGFDKADRMPETQQISSYYLQRAKLYIKDNLTSSLNLDQMASYLHITKRHLTRLFSQKVGQSFSHYVQEQRVQKAMELLLETEWTISRIAQETGFESVHYFTRVFNQRTGVSPGQFRKTQLSEVHFSLQ